jgi:hypothetical protein
MTKKDDDGDGLVLLIGVVAASMACGYLYSQPIGWLVFGVSLVVITIIGRIISIWSG